MLLSNGISITSNVVLLIEIMFDGIIKLSEKYIITKPSSLAVILYQNGGIIFSLKVLKGLILPSLSITAST